MNFTEAAHRYVPNYRDLRDNVLQGIIRGLQWELDHRQPSTTDGPDTSATETQVHINVTGAGTKDQIPNSVATAIRDAVRRGQLPRNAL